PAAEAMSTEDAARTSSAASAPDAFEGIVPAEELEATAPSEPPRRPRTTPGIEIGIVITERALLQRLAAVRGRLSLCADQAAAAKWWLSMPMASVSAEGPMPKALSTRRTSPLMPGCRHQGRACP